MSLSGIKKGSKFGGFANAINKTVKPQLNQNNPANQAGQGSPAEKTVVQEENKVTPVIAAPEVPAAPSAAEEKPAVEVKTETAAETVANDTTPEDVVEEVNDQIEETTLETVSTEKAEKKPSNKKTAAKAGRKAVLGECKKLNISIPIEMIEEMESAALILHKGNLNSYIRACIKKDLKENKKTYEKMKELMKFNEE